MKYGSFITIAAALTVGCGQQRVDVNHHGTVLVKHEVSFDALRPLLDEVCRAELPGATPEQIEACIDGKLEKLIGGLS